MENFIFCAVYVFFSHTNSFLLSPNFPWFGSDGSSAIGTRWLSAFDLMTDVFVRLSFFRCFNSSLRDSITSELVDILCLPFKSPFHFFISVANNYWSRHIWERCWPWSYLYFHSILGDGLRFSFWLNMCMSSEKKSCANIRKTLLFSVLFS